jgi:hypothetical protein
MAPGHTLPTLAQTQFADLSLLIFEPRPLIARHLLVATWVELRPLHPMAQCFRQATDLLRDRSHRLPARAEPVLMLEERLSRSISDLLRLGRN